MIEVVIVVIGYILVKWLCCASWSWAAYAWFLVWLVCTTLLACLALDERMKQQQALCCPSCLRSLVRDAATHHVRCPKCTSGSPNG